MQYNRFPQLNSNTWLHLTNEIQIVLSFPRTIKCNAKLNNSTYHSTAMNKITEIILLQATFSKTRVKN